MNIKYRINNEWLFQSISDELEPVVKSIEFDSENELIKKLGLLSTDLNIDNIKISYKDLSEVEKYNLFFYNYSSKLKNDAWNILILNEENKNNFLNMYNTFSSKIGSYLKSNENLKNRFKLILGENNIVGLDSHNSIINFIETIENAYNDIISNKINKRIIYYSFNFEELYPKDLEIFLNNCFNKKIILNEYSDSKNVFEFILKLPTILSNNFEAIYINKNTYLFFEGFLTNLEKIKKQEDLVNHIFEYNNLLLKQKDILLPLRFIDSSKIIIREKIKIEDILYKII